MKTTSLNKITVLWPLPPWKWISQYVKWFVKALWERTEVELLDFKQLYPERLYPGWSPKQKSVEVPEYPWVSSTQVLTWRNPFSRIYAWITISWQVLHMQYWIRFLAPIYIVVWCIARYIKKIPVVITIHNVQPHEKARWKTYIDKIVYAVAHRFIVHSAQNREQLISLVWNKKKVTIFPHWIIVPEVVKIDTLRARDEFWIAHESNVILFFWVIRPYKWLHIAIQALSKLNENHDHYHMIIAWKARWDRSEYQHEIETYWLENQITRVSWFLDDQQLSFVFWASDLLILPYTHFDAQSWVVALWLWFDIPIIVSNLWWLTEVIDDNAYVHEVWNAEELAQKILHIDPRSSLEFIHTKKNKYSRKTISKDLFSFYENLVNSWR